MYWLSHGAATGSCTSFANIYHSCWSIRPRNWICYVIAVWFVFKQFVKSWKWVRLTVYNLSILLDVRVPDSNNCSSTNDSTYHVVRVNFIRTFSRIILWIVGGFITSIPHSNLSKHHLRSDGLIGITDRIIQKIHSTSLQFRCVTMPHVAIVTVLFVWVYNIVRRIHPWQ